MIRKLQAIAISILFLSGLVSPSQISANTWIPGVSEGDYFTYEMYGVYTFNHSNMALTVPTFEQNITDWVRINITSVSGSIVNQIYTLHLVDGNEVFFSFLTDVNPNNQGVFKISEKGVPICSAELKAGDQIPTAELVLNQTLEKIYACGLRETNHASWHMSDDWGNIYFDRETGMLVELERTHVFVNSATGDKVEKTDIIRLLDTNRWQITGA